MYLSTEQINQPEVKINIGSGRAVLVFHALNFSVGRGISLQEECQVLDSEVSAGKISVWAYLIVKATLIMEEPP